MKSDLPPELSEINIDFCRTNDGIINGTNNQLNGRCDSKEIGFAKNFLIEYFSSYIECFPMLLESLNEKSINDSEKQVIKQYT